MSSSSDTESALPPPEGQVSNFTNPSTLLPAVIVTSVLVYLITTVATCARLFTKAYIIREHHVEDFLTYLAWAGFMTYTAVLIHLEDYGLARHMWDIRLVQLPHMLYYLNVLYCLYAPTTAAAKLSVLFQIKRIFASGGHNRVWWVIVVSIVLNGIFYFGLFWSYIFECWPREKIWNSEVPGRCINGNSSNLAAGILNLISDTEALLLPAWAIWHLNMPIKRKLNAFAVFGVGSIAVAIGIGGIYIRVLVLRTADFTWEVTKLGLLAISEIAVVITVGCSPIVPRLYVYLRRPTRKGLSDEVAVIHGPRTTDGSGGMEYSDNRKRSRKGGPLASSLAKYMGPGGSIGMTTLGSHVDLEEDQFELRPQGTTDIIKGPDHGKFGGQ